MRKNEIKVGEDYAVKDTGWTPQEDVYCGSPELVKAKVVAEKIQTRKYMADKPGWTIEQATEDANGQPTTTVRFVDAGEIIAPWTEHEPVMLRELQRRADEKVEREARTRLAVAKANATNDDLRSLGLDPAVRSQDIGYWITVPWATLERLVELAKRGPSGWRPKGIDPTDHDLVWVWGPSMAETDGMSYRGGLGVQMAEPALVGGSVRWVDAQHRIEWWFEGVTHWAPVATPEPPVMAPVEIGGQ